MEALPGLLSLTRLLSVLSSPPLFILIGNTLNSAPEVFLAGGQTDTSPAV